MALNNQDKIILFFSYLITRQPKEQLIWIYALSKIKKMEKQIIPVYDFLYKTNTQFNHFKRIVTHGNQYLQSISFEYTFMFEGENLLISKIDIPKKQPKQRLNKKEIFDSKLNKHQELINQIIEYLNQCAGTQWDTSTQLFNQAILDRIEEGFIWQNFKHVIEVKCNEWLKSDVMNKHLNPKTLFGDKMHIYVKEILVIKANPHDTNRNALDEARRQNLFSANPTTD